MRRVGHRLVAARDPSEHKEQTAATYKGGFGFHPIYCFADATGEALAVKMRPCNAGANSIADHVGVLDATVGQLLPKSPPGTGAATTRRRCAVTPRCGSTRPGCTPFVWEARARKIGFAVPELTGLVDLSDWPEGTRLIVRRGPLHPRRVADPVPSMAYRYWGHYTDADGEPVDLDVDMRAHARVKDQIRRLKETGAQRFQFTAIDTNRCWLALACFADNLVRWFQQLCVRPVRSRRTQGRPLRKSGGAEPASRQLPTSRRRARCAARRKPEPAVARLTLRMRSEASFWVGGLKRTRQLVRVRFRHVGFAPIGGARVTKSDQEIGSSTGS